MFFYLKKGIIFFSQFTSIHIILKHTKLMKNSDKGILSFLGKNPYGGF